MDDAYSRQAGELIVRVSKSRRSRKYLLHRFLPDYFGKAKRRMNSEKPLLVYKMATTDNFCTWFGKVGSGGMLFSGSISAEEEEEAFQVSQSYLPLSVVVVVVVVPRWPERTVRGLGCQSGSSASCGWGSSRVGSSVCGGWLHPLGVALVLAGDALQGGGQLPGGLGGQQHCSDLRQLGLSAVAALGTE